MRPPESISRLSNGKLMRLERSREFIHQPQRWRWAWLALWLCLPLCAADLVLLWDHSPTVERVTEYRLYQRTDPATNFVKVATIPSSTNTVTLTNIASSALAFYVTAANVREESEPSNILELPPKPGKVSGFVIVEVKVEVKAANTVK